MIDRYALKKLLNMLDRITHGTLTLTVPGGKNYSFSGHHEGHQAHLVIHDIKAIFSFFHKGDVGFAEAYRNGWWDSEDLTKVFLFAMENERIFDPYICGNFISRMALRFSYVLKRNTLTNSKYNIHAHYDLGNDFYALWLDPSMTYSSALFAYEAEELTMAQYRKYDRIIERLGSSGKLLEIGCGWGSFAERALTQKDYAIKGLTLSDAQCAYAQNRLGGQASIVLEDYRRQKGLYDHIVSIEMFEAVGQSFWPLYFSQLKSLLAQKGKALIQTITIKETYFERYRTSGDPIRTFIFPGGMLPSLERFTQASLQAGLRVTDQFAFGKDYALTLRRWLERFEQEIDGVKALGFDTFFIRLWRFYLTFCIASFTGGRTDVLQIQLEHGE